jgi:hypothetical protein
MTAIVVLDGRQVVVRFGRVSGHRRRRLDVGPGTIREFEDAIPGGR